jgi:hypothetical protein
MEAVLRKSYLNEISVLARVYKAELGRYLALLEWDTLFSSIETCEELVYVFNNVVS